MTSQQWGWDERKINKQVIYQTTSLPNFVTFDAFYFSLCPKTLSFERYLGGKAIATDRPPWIRVSYYYTVRLDDVKVFKSRWNFVQTKTTTPGNNIYTLLITFIAFTLFISSKFQTLFVPYKLSYYAQAYLWYKCVAFIQLRSWWKSSHNCS